MAITWWGNIRFEKTFTPELAELLARSGCVAVSGGLEVASDRLLTLMKKGVTVEQVARVTRAFTDAGIMVHAYLMYGFPTETEQETIDALERVRQLFAAGCIQSAFWHRFAATAHSPIGREPERSASACARRASARPAFARNELPFEDPAGCDHELPGPRACARRSTTTCTASASTPTCATGSVTPPPQPPAAHPPPAGAARSDPARALARALIRSQCIRTAPGHVLGPGAGYAPPPAPPPPRPPAGYGRVRRDRDRDTPANHSAAKTPETHRSSGVFPPISGWSVPCAVGDPAPLPFKETVMATLGSLARLRRLSLLLPGRRRVAVFLSTLVAASAGVSAWAIVSAPDLQIVAQHHAPVHVKTFQDDLNNLVRSGRGAEAFILAFERGDEIFGAQFNALDGIGANVGNGERFTRVPRSDLKGLGQWFAHSPPRVTGPNAQTCFECHNIPFEDGAGLISGNIHRDTARSGDAGQDHPAQRPPPVRFGRRAAAGRGDDRGAADQGPPGDRHLRCRPAAAPPSP